MCFYFSWMCVQFFCVSLCTLFIHMKLFSYFLFLVFDLQKIIYLFFFNLVQIFCVCIVSMHAHIIKFSFILSIIFLRMNWNRNSYVDAHKRKIKFCAYHKRDTDDLKQVFDSHKIIIRMQSFVCKRNFVRIWFRSSSAVEFFENILIIGRWSREGEWRTRNRPSGPKKRYSTSFEDLKKTFWLNANLKNQLMLKISTNFSNPPNLS